MNFKLAFVWCALLAGCASHVETPPLLAQQAAPTVAPARTAQHVEVRHFYLLSPGPNATLVVTRSDVAPAAH
jgi:hypothetical protein